MSHHQSSGRGAQRAIAILSLLVVCLVIAALVLSLTQSCGRRTESVSGVPQATSNVIENGRDAGLTEAPADSMSEWLEENGVAAAEAASPTDQWEGE